MNLSISHGYFSLKAIADSSFARQPNSLVHSLVVLQLDVVNSLRLGKELDAKDRLGTPHCW